jgi:hypothetical protein
MDPEVDKSKFKQLHLVGSSTYIITWQTAPYGGSVYESSQWCLRNSQTLYITNIIPRDLTHSIGCALIPSEKGTPMT